MKISDVHLLTISDYGRVKIAINGGAEREGKAGRHIDTETGRQVAPAGHVAMAGDKRNGPSVVNYVGPAGQLSKCRYFWHSSSVSDRVTRSWARLMS